MLTARHCKRPLVRTSDYGRAVAHEPRKAPRLHLDDPDLWPDGTTLDLAADRAQELARRLNAALDRETVTLRQASEMSGISVGAISNVKNGAAWPDVLTVFRLETALRSDLWPPRAR